MSELPSVCVVTHPLGSAGENATRSLLDILGAITTVSLVTANLPSTSSIRDDHEVIELTESGTGSSIPRAAVRFSLNQLRMCHEIVRCDEEIVLFFGATSYVLPILWAKLLGKTVILEPRGNVPLTLELNWKQRVPASIAQGLAGVVRLLERTGYRLADGIVTYTTSMAEELDLEQYEEKLYTNGARYVDTDKFRPKIQYENRDRTIGFLGRLDEEKGIRDLVDVARELPDDITFTFVGDGDLRKWLETELASEIETNSVEVIGWVDHEDVPEVLSRFQLLVMPSQPTEGLPTVILEALACGTPVYATPVAGIPDVVKEDETGMLMSVRDSETASNRIEKLLDGDSENMSSNGRRLIESEYSFEVATDRYRTILSSIDS